MTGTWPGGEEELIQSLFAPLAAGFPGALGLKDDCACLTPPAGHDLVLTTDAAAAGVHFFPDDAPADIAWKALAANVSDLTAKGARPIAYLMALSFPEPPQRGWAEAFAAGLGAAQDAFSIVLAGGDTDRRPGPLTVTITAIGSVPCGRMVRRSGARPGDRLFVSGTIGDSTLGLRLRSGEAHAAALGLDDTQASHLIARYLRPTPRVALAPHLVSYASGALDISDGLLKDCGHLARASGVAAVIEAAQLPLSDAARAALARRPGLLPVAAAGGDDYEVLAALPPVHAPAFAAAALASGVAVTEIGRIEAGTGVTLLAADGRPIAPERDGWDHFPN